MSSSTPFELQPTLTGALLKLRPLRAEDYDALYAVASDPFIWEQHPESTRWQPDVFSEFFRIALESGGALVAIDKEIGRIVGSSRYLDYRPDECVVEIGFSFLARSHWGGRFNGDMKRLMLDHAFRFVDRVVFVVGVRNVRSQKAVEKIGGVRVGTRLDPRGGETVVFEIARDAAPT